MLKIAFDNNIIDKILENIDVFLSKKERCQYFVCPQVAEELASISDDKKETRIRLFISLCQMEATFLMDSVNVWDHSRFDVSKYGDGEIYSKIININKTNIADAIIADTAVSNNCTLLTEDTRLFKAMGKLGYNVISFNEFMNI